MWHFNKNIIIIIIIIYVLMKESIFFFNWLSKFSTFYYKSTVQYVISLTYASEIGQLLNILKIKKFIFSFILKCQIVPGNLLVHLINECLYFNSVLF